MEDKRRSFLRKAAIGGGLTAFAAGASTTAGRMLDHVLGKDKPKQRLDGNSLAPEFSVNPGTGALRINPEQQVSYTMCMGCTTFCGVRVRIDKKSGKVLRVAGNPYSPLSADPPLPFQTSIRGSFVSLTRYQEKGLKGRSTACGRGNGVLEQMDSPFRVLAEPCGSWRPQERRRFSCPIRMPPPTTKHSTRGTSSAGAERLSSRTPRSPRFRRS